MTDPYRYGRRVLRSGARALATLVAVALPLALAAPSAARAQAVAGGDFDVCDNLGTLRGKTAFLSGRTGFGTSRGVFVVVNGANSSQDCSNDGFTAGVDFTNLTVTNATDFVNVADPSLSILRSNLVIADFLNPVRNGFSRNVGFYVNIPSGTPAGRYTGRFDVLDPTNPPALNPTGQALRSDYVLVEIEVLANSGIGLVQSDTAARADSLTLRGRPGQTVNGVVRVANLGNVGLQNVRLEVTDLIATSGTGLRIRSDRITFSPSTLATVARGDTTRVTVSVRIPAGLLAGSYRGDLIAQGDGVTAIRIPLTVIVTTPGDIVFETNPVVGRTGDNAVIIFNADPGSSWEMAIFDMRALIAFKTTGTVFAGTTGTPGRGFAGDQAVRTVWNLANNRGEAVAGGMYYVIINAIQDGQRRQLRGKLMVIR